MMTARKIELLIGGTSEQLNKAILIPYIFQIKYQSGLAKLFVNKSKNPQKCICFKLRYSVNKWNIWYFYYVGF